MIRITSSIRNFERSGPSASPMPVESTRSAIRTETIRRSPVATATAQLYPPPPPWRPYAALTGFALREGGEPPATGVFDGGERMVLATEHRVQDKLENA